MTAWVVVEYEQVDVREFGDLGPRSTPGTEVAASVVHLDGEGTESAAIAKSATYSGWYAAFPLPEMEPKRAELKVVSG